MRTRLKTFADFFSGVGGVSLGLQRAGWRCVFANDHDKYACQVYHERFGSDHLIEGPIEQIPPETIPSHTLLSAGFPCQSFSVAGKRAGFKDPRGNMFFYVARVAAAKRPPLLLLENVKGLLSADKGSCFWKILQTLDELGYDAEWQVLNSKHHGVPQNRTRVFIIGHLRTRPTPQIFPLGQADGLAEKKSCVRPKVPAEISAAVTARINAGWRSQGQTQYIASALDASYRKGIDRHGQRTHVASQKTHIIYDGPTYANMNTRVRPTDVMPTLDTKGGHWKVLSMHRNRSGNVGIHEEETVALRAMASHNYMLVMMPVVIADRTRTKAGLGRNLESPKNIANTLTRKQNENLLLLENWDIRRLMPIECERLQSFPDGWTAKGLTPEGIPVDVSDSQRYKQLGNAVTVNVVEFLGRLLGRLQLPPKKKEWALDCWWCCICILACIFAIMNCHHCNVINVNYTISVEV